MQKLRSKDFYVVEILPSDNPLKKYIAIVTNDKKYYMIYFGAIKPNGKPYEQFEDRTPLNLFKKYNHYDIERRLNYLKRHRPDYSYINANTLSAIYLW